MKKIFIDAGAHEGKVSMHFHRKNRDFIIYAFEPNPYMCPSLPPNSNLVRSAVWTRNEQQPFYVYKNDKRSEGCTLLREKGTHKLDFERPVMVQCINFSEWLMTMFNPVDFYIVLKMDIEGAEYDVLRSMLDNGTMYLVKELYPEWHWKKIGMGKTEHLEVVKAVAQSVELHREYAKEYRL